jgi:peroxiredoxin
MKFFFLLLVLVFIASNVKAETLTEQLNARKKASKGKINPEVATEFRRATAELRLTGIEKSSLQKGVKAPEFHLGGKPFFHYLEKSPVVLKFYRGSWCPYCNLELAAYHKHYADFKQKGYELIFLTPDRPSEVKKTLKKNGYTFPMFTDIDNVIAKKFGIAFKLDEKVNEIYKKFGIDLMKAQDNTSYELPMPGTYVIQKDGTISFAHADADYTNRIDPLDLLKKL